MGAKITLKDVARAAGVSVATASQALRNDSNSSRATCARVQQIAKELGYVPDPALAQLAARRFRRSGDLSGSVIVFATHNSPPREGRNWRYLAELVERARERGYQIRHVRIDGRETLRQEARRWFYQGVRGVIFGQFEHDDWIEEVDWSPFSVIILGGRCPRMLFNTVKADAFLSMSLALSRLQDATAGAVGVMLHLHSVDLIDDRLREGAVLTWMERLPPERRVPILFEHFDTPYAVQLKRTKAWLKAHRPQGVAGFAIVQRILLDLGYFSKVDNQYVASMHDVHDRELGFVGFMEPTREEANRAIDMLDGMIRHGETGRPEHPIQMMVPSLWMDKPARA